MTAPHFVRPDHHELPRGSRTDGQGHDGSSLAARPKQSTAPPGLWAAAAPVPVEVVKAKKANRPRPSRAKPRKPRVLAPCGTEAAYRRHLSNGSETCEPCREAHAAFKREKSPTKVRKQYIRPDCGTEKGYSSHRHRKERACDPCREAHNAAQRARRELRLTKAGREYQPRQSTAACGSASGYKRHRRNGEDACEPCKAAKRADNQYWQTTRKKEAA